jgi:homoserine kinase
MRAMPLSAFGADDRPLDLFAGDRLIISVPASAANLGPAMDGLGMSVGLRLTVTVSAAANAGVEAAHEGTSRVRAVLRSFGAAVADRSFVSAVADRAFVSANDIPIERGLGGSGAVRLAALLAASAILRGDPDTDRILADASALEGHPDNVAASLCGGVVASASLDDGRVASVELGALSELSVALAIPQMRISTTEARNILPDSLPHVDARFTASRVALLVAAIAERRFDLFDEATRDRLHQPYRLRLVPGGAHALDAARQAGALAAFLSGSGSTLAAFAAAMVERLADHGTRADPSVVRLDGNGAEVTAIAPDGLVLWGWRWRAPVRTDQAD